MILIAALADTDLKGKPRASGDDPSQALLAWAAVP